MDSGTSSIKIKVEGVELGYEVEKGPAVDMKFKWTSCLILCFLFPIFSGVKWVSSVYLRVYPTLACLYVGRNCAMIPIYEKRSENS